MFEDTRLRACLFRAKSYNARIRVTQKDAGLKLVLFTGPGASRAAKPWVAPVLSPCNFSQVGRDWFRPPHVGSLQDTNLGLSKFPIFLCRTNVACYGTFAAKAEIS